MTRQSLLRLTPIVGLLLVSISVAVARPQDGKTPAQGSKSARPQATAPQKSAARDGSPKKVDVSIFFLTEINIAQSTIDVDSLVKWVRPAIADMESRFAGESSRRSVVIQVTLHKDRPADVAVAGQPAPSDAEVKDLLRAVNAKDAPRSKVIDCSFRIVAQINGGPADPKQPLSPRLVTPDERRLEAFRAARTAEKLEILRRWARTEALPILAATASGVDARYKGVRNLGAAIRDLAPDRPIDVPALTDRNPNYWRAMVEMAPGDPLVPMIRVALHTANGEIDRARRYSNVASFFDANRTGASRLLGDFRTMLGLFARDVESRIAGGIALNDKGQLAEAMAVYDGVLRDYPGSAWARYERVQTRIAMAAKQGKPVDDAFDDWPRVRDSILAADPLYEMLANAEGVEETYRLVLRIEIRTLFKDQNRTIKDLVRYADIARDLGDYGFAAFIYWNMLGRVPPKDLETRDLHERFLFCLEELGVKGIKDSFKGDHAAAFARMKQELQKRIKAGPGKDEDGKGAQGKPAAVDQ